MAKKGEFQSVTSKILDIASVMLLDSSSVQVISNNSSYVPELGGTKEAFSIKGFVVAIVVISGSATPSGTFFYIIDKDARVVNMIAASHRKEAYK